MNTENIFSFSLVLLCIGLAFFLQNSAKAADQNLRPQSQLKFQSMPPRRMPSKRRSYPLLEQLEKELYPSHDFRAEPPGNRLERLEIAVLGSKQTGHISQRLHTLRTEIENWQISSATKANLNNDSEMQLLKAQIRAAELEAKNTQKMQIAEFQANQQLQQSQERYRYSKLLMQNRDRNSEDQRLMQLINPVVRGISQEGISSMFRGRN